MTCRAACQPNPWTPAEEAELIRLHSTGVSFLEMSIALGRARSSISTRCYQLGLSREKTKWAKGDALYDGRRYADVKLRERVGA